MKRKPNYPHMKARELQALRAIYVGCVAGHPPRGLEGFSHHWLLLLCEEYSDLVFPTYWPGGAMNSQFARFECFLDELALELAAHV